LEVKDHRYYDMEEGGSRRQPPRYAMSDGFYESHKDLLGLAGKSMVRARVGMADRGFVYFEKCQFVRVSKGTDIFAGHHRVSQDGGRVVSYSADEGLEAGGGNVEPIFVGYRGRVQGVTVHRCFVNLEHRFRYLEEGSYKEKVKSVLCKEGGFWVEGISREWGGSKDLPYLGGAEGQGVIMKWLVEEVGVVKKGEAVGVVSG